MNNIKATIVADSINDKGDRITSMLVTLPRFILSELNTHRLFSRNSASSRAIPFEKTVKSVEENPFIPIAWQKVHKGMQGTEYLTLEVDIKAANKEWLIAKEEAINSAISLNHSCSVTKQLCNRLLEPFMYHTVLITATQWSNFFDLRCPRYEFFHYSKNEKIYFKSKKEYINYTKECLHETIYNEILTYSELDWLNINKGQAEIHMMDLAEKMYDAINESTPKLLKEGEYHIPFGDNINESLLHEYLYKNNIGKSYETLEDYKVKIAIARCARTSYTVFGEEKSDNYEADLKLFDRLKESGHASPMEHIAQVMTIEEYENNYIIENGIKTKGISRNFKGFKQYRQIINL